jgi:DNA primase catalytic core, N-terminal domain
MQLTQVKPATDNRLAELMTDAGAFFEDYLWESDAAGAARQVLAGHGLEDKLIRRFGVGYAPVGPDELMAHLRERGYSTEEIIASGLARRSGRGRVHAYFRSRIMFPIRDRDGGIVGFAGLGTHLGPSWPMWVVSPDVGLYRRSEAVFGLDVAAKRIASTKVVVVVGDCVDVLKAHQDGRPTAVTVHTGGVTEEQIEAMASGVRGGESAMDLDLDGIEIEPEFDPRDLATASRPAPVPEREPAPNLELKRMLLVMATALVGINTFTGAPLLAVWVGAQAQGGRVLSLRGVVTVLVVLAIVEFLLGLALTWLSATYDRVTGRPRFAGETSPWQRAKRGDRVQDIRSRFGMSAPEKVVAACVVLGVLTFEIWFFFLAGTSLPHQ